MENVEVHGEPRVAAGKGGVRQLRREGKTPGVIYGKGEETIAFSLNAHDFAKILRKQGGGTFVIDLRLKGQEDRELTTIIRELQRDPVSSKVLHVDLQHVSMTQLIQVKIPVHLTGTALGVKEGGILDQLAREVEVECQAAKIPEDVKFDVSEYQIGQSFHVSDLTLPEEIRMVTPDDRVVGSVIAKLVVEEPTPVADVDEEAKEGEEAEADKEEGEGASKDSKA